jgi:phosphoserine phosphatase
MRPLGRAIGAIALASAVAGVARAADPLPSWNDGAAKRAIVAFVEQVTKPDGPGFVPPAERIAVFDNDGTLWAEQPLYFQLAFAIDRVKALAPQHPEWKTREPFASLLRGDTQAALAGGEHALLEIVAATHSGTTTDEFQQIATEWLASARHPTLGRPFTDLVYQPMLELLAHLRSNGFETFIVSGGGVEFLRAFAEQSYGIPPQQVIGSRGKTKFEIRDGRPAIVKEPGIDFVDDAEGKPVAIQQQIGRRPIAAFGNSDGDLAMLQWTCLAQGPRLCLVVHHTDAAREWAYDRKSSIGRLDRSIAEAAKHGWTVVSIRDDWKRVFAFEAR